ncbi:MAG: hypothetical protein KOO69_07755 [Victivallales bacterium]|nr:hypothetical protein [Victivallales bacterium]
MNLNFDISLIKNYNNKSQISRVLTENWVSNNIFCPNCGNNKLSDFENNSPVADFFCLSCQEEFELKSKKGNLGNKIVDGAYHTMIKRINAENNPNFFFLTYHQSNWSVRDFLIIPKHYFVTDLIEKRKPLSENARRAGWIGCNIIMNRIPCKGRIFLVENSKMISQEKVLKQWKSTLFLTNYKQKSRGWLIDIMNCVDAVSDSEFKLDQIYEFEDILKQKHPQNNFIKDKIRQQLQILRDKGVLEFVSKGVYRKIL